jgi:hypothetical protein
MMLKMKINDALLAPLSSRDTMDEVGAIASATVRVVVDSSDDVAVDNGGVTLFTLFSLILSFPLL